jgi:predicted protein tyrosine phosphatase
MTSLKNKIIKKMNSIQRNYIYHYFDKNIKNSEDIPNNIPDNNEYTEDIHIFIVNAKQKSTKNIFKNIFINLL